jgi:hypothetical protein
VVQINSDGIEKEIVEQVKKDLVEIFTDQNNYNDDKKEMKLVSIILEDNNKISHVPLFENPQNLIFGDLYLYHNLLGYKLNFFILKIFFFILKNFFYFILYFLIFFHLLYF